MARPEGVVAMDGGISPPGPPDEKAKKEDETTKVNATTSGKNETDKQKSGEPGPAGNVSVRKNFK